MFAILFLLLSEPWHDKTYKTMNTKIRLHTRLGYTAAQSNEYLRLPRTWIAKDMNLLHPYSKDWSDCVDVQADPSFHWALMWLSRFCCTLAYWWTPQNLPGFSQRFIFTDITPSRTLRLYIPPYLHKRIRLAEIIKFFFHMSQLTACSMALCSFRGKSRRTWYLMSRF